MLHPHNVVTTGNFQIFVNKFAYCLFFSFLNLRKQKNLCSIVIVHLCMSHLCGCMWSFKTEKLISQSMHGTDLPGYTHACCCNYTISMLYIWWPIGSPPPLPLPPPPPPPLFLLVRVAVMLCRLRHTAAASATTTPLPPPPHRYRLRHRHTADASATATPLTPPPPPLMQICARG